MANLIAASSYDNVYQIEQTDVARGGAGNLANAQAQSLLNRTEWLKAAMRGYNGITLLNSAKTLTAADYLQNLVVIYANTAYTAYLLPVLTNTDLGVRIAISAHNIAKQVTITSQGSNDIIVGSMAKQSLYLGDGDSIELIWSGSSWILLNFIGNFTDVSVPFYSYYQLPNTVIAGGQILNRADYPRLWECVNANLASSTVTDLVWNTTAGKKGFYSSGDGSTTFRVPDLRSMFMRGLDLGAGIDYDRVSNNAGEYEGDIFKSHNHTWETQNSNDSLGGSGYVASSNGGEDGRNTLSSTIGNTGGQETRPKNIGLLPLIKV